MTTKTKTNHDYSVEIETPEQLDAIRDIIEDSWLNHTSAEYDYPTDIAITVGKIFTFEELDTKYTFDEWKNLPD